MTGPFIFVTTFKLMKGERENYKKWVEGLCEYVESNESRLIAFTRYLGEEGTAVTGVQVHPDAASLVQRRGE